MYIYISSLSQDEGTIIIPILQIRNPRHRKWRRLVRELKFEPRQSGSNFCVLNHPLFPISTWQSWSLAEEAVLSPDGNIPAGSPQSALVILLLVVCHTGVPSASSWRHELRIPDLLLSLLLAQTSLLFFDLQTNIWLVHWATSTPGMSRRRLQPDQVCHPLPGSIPMSAHGSTVYPAHKSEAGHVLDSSAALLPTTGQVMSSAQHPHWSLESAPFSPHCIPPRPPCKRSHPQVSLPLGDCELYYCLQSLQVSISGLWSEEKRRTGEAWAQSSGMVLPSGRCGLHVHSSLFSTLICSRPNSDASSSLSLGCAPSQTFSQVPPYCVSWAWRDSCGPKVSLTCHVLLLKFMWSFHFTP